MVSRATEVVQSEEGRSRKELVEDTTIAFRTLEERGVICIALCQGDKVTI